ncbi:MAG: SUMF1/EgtB/PvdO family nonheme iron enzyme [Myxococcales bacterium]|nr:SUMF1/EgtB/PvdO family nonheme iron enzyme [Myxococcales bacterium]
MPIPQALFQVGATDGRPDELGAPSGQVAAFCIDDIEVTVAAYRACVDSGACRPPTNGQFCNWARPDRDDHPVNCVAWDEADQYCRHVNERLPSEEEWEYAARGVDGRRYPWGDAHPEQQLCWKRLPGELGTCIVGTHPAGDSLFGAHDMAGNVWEWTGSGYSADYSQPRDLSCRVIRGGSWMSDDAADVRAHSRDCGTFGARYDNVGFRCARDLPGASGAGSTAPGVRDLF